MSSDASSDDAAAKADAVQNDVGDGDISDKTGDGAEEMKEDSATRDNEPEGEGEASGDQQPEEEEAVHGQDDTENGDGDGAPPAKKPTNGLVIGLIIAVGVAAFFAGAYSISMYQEQPDQLTQEDLDDALAKLELKIMQQQMAALQEQQQQQQPPTIRISADDDPTIGDADAPITIIEFSDFQCPFCARFSSQTLPSIQEEYIDKGLVKLVYRDFPLQHIHPNAAVTALAAECADDQGGFKGMHDILFEKQGEWNRAGPQDIIELLSGYASDTGIDAAEFEECVVMGTHVEDIRGDLEDGRAYGVTGTPGFFIGNDDVGYVSIEGAQPYDVFKRIIDSQLER
ncbi:MAG: thioredoxin domain-containing protein [Thaumarchaeota archaeon]|nr:thioredoxin domain-containing protein [Nitrososphaerota archaeon]MDE0525920.1 thioredoxin domain-containing protein [Nitrososphaerota archaeon]